MDKKAITAAQFRTFVGVVIGLLIVWYSMPGLLPSQEPRAQALRGMTGYGAILPQAAVSALSTALIVGQLVGLLGMWMLKPWGKWLLLLAVIGTAASSPFVGFAVETPLGVFTGFLSTLLEGVLLAIAFNVTVTDHGKSK